MLLQKFKNIESRMKNYSVFGILYAPKENQTTYESSAKLKWIHRFVRSYFFQLRICLVLLQKFINFNFKYISVTRVTVFDWLDWTILIVLELLFVGKIKYCQWYIDVNGAQRPKPITWQLHLYAKQIKQ